jgi:BolA protein
MIAHYERKPESWQYPGNPLTTSKPALGTRSAPSSDKEYRMQVRTILQQKLTDGLTPSHLEIVDESHRHHGHAGSNSEGESHFHIEIVSAAFEGKSAVARQRLVYGLLAEELKSRVHALSLSTLTPAEAGAK